MTEWEQVVYDEAINIIAATTKQVLKDNIQAYPEDFAQVIALPNGIKELADKCVVVLLGKAKRDVQEADKGCALLLTAGATFIRLNSEAITNKVVELYSADKK